jgi:hypothetical protein
MMTSAEQITMMTNAIRQAIKIMGDRFGSTEQDVAKTIQELKASIQPPVVLVKDVPAGAQAL